MNLRRAWALLCCLFAGSALAAPEIALQSGQSASFTIPAQSFSTSYYIDVDASGAHLQLELDGPASTNSTDLYLRYGTPFADRTANADAAPDAALFNDYAHYRGIFFTGDESINVFKSSTVPLRAGRWYIAVVNIGTTPAPVSLAATVRSQVAVAPMNIVFGMSDERCVPSAWDDATPVQPIDGNPGTTLGEQRRNALQHAGERLMQQLGSPVPIMVRACWSRLGGDPERGAPIASAGPSQIYAADIGNRAAWLPDNYTWYASAQVTRLSGNNACSTMGSPCSGNDVVAFFNVDIDPPRLVVQQPFYYGYTGANKPEQTIDFVSTAMHELTHGLGFFGLTVMDPLRGPIGSRFRFPDGVAYDDSFGRMLVTLDAGHLAYTPFYAAETSDADRAAALVSETGLRWSGQEAVSSLRNQRQFLPIPENFPLMYAPCERVAASDPCKLSPGSTLSHTAQDGELMNAFYSGGSPRSLGLALPMLNALGWSNAPATAATPAAPIAGNWYDRRHSGHGLDFQLYQRDALNGDLYFVIFYTFESDRQPEYYLGLGRVIDGKFLGAKQGDGIALMRLRYDAQLRRTQLDTSSRGSLVIDFNQAAQSPHCRSADRSGAGALAVMRWSIREERGTWCLEPAVLPANRTQPDFSGHWYGGNTNDQGWGMELLSIRGAAGQAQLVAVLYYPDQQGRSRWAVTQLADVDLANTPELTLYEVTGYCRVCEAPTTPNATRAVGTLKLKLTRPTRTEPADGANRVSIAIAQPGVADFRRDDVPLTLLSAPPGN